MPKFLVEVRDSAYRRTGVIEQYTSLEVISRFCDVGAWVLRVPADYWGGLLSPGAGVVVWAEGSSEPIMSGPVTGIIREWDKDSPGAGVITFSGVSDELILWGRTTYPVPGASIYEQTADTASGREPAGAAIVGLVNANAGPGARGNRRVPGLVVEPATFGPVVSWNSRFDVLGVKCRELALANGVGWRLRQGESGQVIFRVYTPQDLSSKVIFSREMGNLAGYKYELAAPLATRFLVAAQGEGRYRYIKPYVVNGTAYMVDPSEDSGTYVSPPDGWFTYWPEMFVDRRDIPVAYNNAREIVDPDTGEPASTDALAAIDSAVAEDAVEAAAKASLSITPIDSATLRFGTHYNLGDTVTVDVDGVRITDILREVRLTDSADGGPKVTPVVGSSNASGTPYIYREIKRIWASLRKLEARL